MQELITVRLNSKLATSRILTNIWVNIELKLGKTCVNVFDHFQSQPKGRNEVPVILRGLAVFTDTYLQRVIV